MWVLYGSGQRFGGLTTYPQQMTPQTAIDPTEQTALAAIQDPHRQGHSLRRIAAILNSRWLRTRRDAEWRLESVARVLKLSILSPLTNIA